MPAGVPWPFLFLSCWVKTSICTLPDFWVARMYETQGGTLAFCLVLEPKLVSVLCQQFDHNFVDLLSFYAHFGADSDPFILGSFWISFFVWVSLFVYIGLSLCLFAGKDLDSSGETLLLFWSHFECSGHFEFSQTIEFVAPYVGVRKHCNKCTHNNKKSEDTETSAFAAPLVGFTKTLQQMHQFQCPHNNEKFWGHWNQFICCTT